eukprot:2391036-Pleurochrysis_carterae.AAC.1
MRAEDASRTKESPSTEDLKLVAAFLTQQGKDSRRFEEAFKHCGAFKEKRDAWDLVARSRPDARASVRL